MRYIEEASRWAPDAPTVPAAEPFIAPPARRARVLVADDNADMRIYLKQLLQAEWDVETVVDGEAAWRSIKARRPDLVLSDVMMPQLDGFGLLQRVRSDPQTQSIPFIVLSARAGEESRIEGLQAGADDYCIKPFSAKELLARVATHLKLADARRAVETERGRLYEFFMQAPVPMVILLGPEHRFFLANEPYEQLVGRKTVGKTVLEAFSEEEVSDFMPLLDGVYRTGVPYVGKELLIHLPDENGVRKECFLDVGYYPCRQSSGETTGILAILQDVTDQVRARKIVEESDRRFQEIANAIPQIVFTATPDGVIDWHNQQWDDYIGYPYSGNPNALGNPMHPDDISSTWRIWEASMAAGQRFQKEYRLKRGFDDQYRWHLGRASPIRDARGTVVKWIGSNTDIHDQKILVEHLESERELRERFVSALTHDLRTPMASAHMAAQLLLRKSQEPL